MTKIFTTGISLNRKIAKKIDIQRGDIPRSRYISKIIEIYLENQEPIEKYKKKKSSDSIGLSSDFESDVGLVA